MWCACVRLCVWVHFDKALLDTQTRARAQGPQREALLRNVGLFLGVPEGDDEWERLVQQGISSRHNSGS